MTFNPSDLTAILPMIATLLLAIIVLVSELFNLRRAAALQIMTAIGLLVVMAVGVIAAGSRDGAFNGMLAADGVSRFMNILLAGVALLAALMSKDYLVRSNPPLPPPSKEGGEGKFTPSEKGGESEFRHGEYYAMLLLATCGMMALANATNLITLFLGIETMSIALYILAGIRSDRPRSSEAALKYLLLGAFSTAFLLYGMALIYGSTSGATNYADIAAVVQKLNIGQASPDGGVSIGTLLPVGLGLLMIGLLFKVAAVPFHFWSPDVYQGAPTPVTAFMSAGPKAAALVAFIRLFGWALPDLSSVWIPALWIVAVATMTVGNIVAIAQKDIKRMLAYSSIAHAGYLLLAILAASNPDVRASAASGLLFYLAAYYLMNIGAFTVAILVSRARPDGDYQIDDYKGLAAQHPLLAAGMAVFMISLAGIPPTAGFFGKLFVFSAAVKAGFISLVVVAVLNSVVSVFYYLRLVVFMYMQPAAEAVRIRQFPAFALVIGICVIGVIKFGLMPGDLLSWVSASTDSMMLPEAR